MKKIIIVEDDLEIRNSLGQIFDSALFTVSAYADADFMLHTQFEYPDIFILDKQLSGIDGLEICRFLKTTDATRHIPVIMLSASPDIIRLSAEYGANAAIEKPFKTKRILELVSICLQTTL